MYILDVREGRLDRRRMYLRRLVGFVGTRGRRRQRAITSEQGRRRGSDGMRNKETGGRKRVSRVNIGDQDDEKEETRRPSAMLFVPRVSGVRLRFYSKETMKWLSSCRMKDRSRVDISGDEHQVTVAASRDIGASHIGLGYFSALTTQGQGHSQARTNHSGRTFCWGNFEYSSLIATRGSSRREEQEQTTSFPPTTTTSPSPCLLPPLTTLPRSPPT